MSEEILVEINIEFMEKAQKIIRAFSWDDDDDSADIRFNFFKKRIGNLIQNQEIIKVDCWDFLRVFKQTCNFKHLHYEDLDDVPYLLARFLNRIDVSLKDTKYKNFDSSGEMGLDLYEMRNILNKYDIELWLLFDEMLAITRLEDSDFVEEWCNEIGLYSEEAEQFLLRRVTDVFMI